MKFALYDNTQNPSRVLGWYDTDALSYKTLPPVEKRFHLTDDQWDKRMDNQWQIKDNQLVVFVYTFTKEQQQQAKIKQAKNSLDKTTHEVVNFLENGEALPRNLAMKRSILKRIIAGEDLSLPE
jgi:hypothetical protein